MQSNYGLKLLKTKEGHPRKVTHFFESYDSRFLRTVASSRPLASRTDTSSPKAT